MAMTIPYLTIARIVLTALSQGNLQYLVPQAWTWHGKEIYLTSTGTFQINSIADTRGFQYANATQGNPILSTFLQNPTNSNLSLKNFLAELLIPGSQGLIIAVQDTSGAGNTISMIVNTIVDIPTGN